MKRLPLIAALLLFGTGAFAQNPVIDHNEYYPWVNIVNPPANTRSHFPRAITIDVQSGSSIIKKTFLNWQTNKDVVMHPMAHGYAGSVNEAVTFNSPSPTYVSGLANDFDQMVCYRRNTDGVMVAIPFFWDGNTNFHYWTSTNNGTTWTKSLTAGTIIWKAGYSPANFRFHRGVIQDADGTLYAPGYVSFSGQQPTSVLLRSTDGGITWNHWSDIQTTAGISYNETSIVRCKDNSILAVIRNGDNPLKQRRSTDNGQTWGSLILCPGLPSNNIGVDPYLHLMPNGVLVLSYGDKNHTYDRKCALMYDPNGTGTNWQALTTTYAGTGGPGEVSTGYTSVISLRNNRIMQFSDRGVPEYPTPAGSYAGISLWTKQIDVVLNYRNRIDLKTQHPAGQVTITTDLTYTNASRPETGIHGAFDASTDYWSGAFRMSNSNSHYTIDLQDTIAINAVSVCLLKGRPQTAKVEWSVDGLSWNLIKQYTAAVHETVDYTSNFGTVRARYVRVLFENNTAGMVGLNEINIFRRADTYEDYAQNKVPWGYTAPNDGFWVSEGVTPSPTGFKSRRALYMDDNNAANKTCYRNNFTASATKTFIFDLRVKQFATNGGGCIQFHLVSGTTTVFQLAVFPNGVIRYNNGAWVAVGSGPVSVPLDTWKTIKVVANASGNTASVYVNDVLIGNNVTRKTTTATSINGYLFGSGGSEPVGDQARFDNVEFYNHATEVAARQVSALSDEPVKKDTTEKVTPAIKVYPNPADSYVTLSLANINPGSIEIIFTNLYGKRIKTITDRVTGESYQTDITLADVPLGICVINVKVNGKTYQSKLVKKQL